LYFSFQIGGVRRRMSYDNERLYLFYTGAGGGAHGCRLTTFAGDIQTKTRPIGTR